MVSRQDVCTIVPAAGRGSRLGGDRPKVFTQITKDDTIWDILTSKLKKQADNHILVLNPDSKKEYGDMVSQDVQIFCQASPVGMGDAIFQGKDFWRKFSSILVVWGDQVHVSDATLNSVVERLGDKDQKLVLPLVGQEDPYVEYIFENDKLVQIKQSREGDQTSPGGLSDIGVFGLSTDGLINSWEKYLSEVKVGAETGEINFLPFLCFLSASEGWEVDSFVINDVDESRGINTPEDLEYFRNKYKK